MYPPLPHEPPPKFADNPPPKFADDPPPLYPFDPLNPPPPPSTPPPPVEPENVPSLLQATSAAVKKASPRYVSTAR